MERINYNVYTKAVIHKDGKVLLGKKRSDINHPLKGEWHFFGGAVEENENPFDTIKREVKEEADLDIKVIDVLDFRNDFIEHNNLHIFFACDILKDNPIPSGVMKFLSS